MGTQRCFKNTSRQASNGVEKRRASKSVDLHGNSGASKASGVAKGREGASKSEQKRKKASKKTSERQKKTSELECWSVGKTVEERRKNVFFLKKSVKEKVKLLLEKAEKKRNSSHWKTDKTDNCRRSGKKRPEKRKKKVKSVFAFPFTVLGERGKSDRHS